MEVGLDFALGDLHLVETDVAAELQASVWQGQAAASDFAASASAPHLRDQLTCQARAKTRHEREDTMRSLVTNHPTIKDRPSHGLPLLTFP